MDFKMHFDISTDEIAKVKKLVVMPELPGEDAAKPSDNAKR